MHYIVRASRSRSNQYTLFVWYLFEASHFVYFQLRSTYSRCLSQMRQERPDVKLVPRHKQRYFSPSRLSERPARCAKVPRRKQRIEWIYLNNQSYKFPMKLSVPEPEGYGPSCFVHQQSLENWTSWRCSFQSASFTSITTNPNDLPTIQYHPSISMMQ